jgi:plasmid stability protein
VAIVSGGCHVSHCRIAVPHVGRCHDETPRGHGSALAERLDCMHNGCMAVHITIRSVPQEVRDELAARAARTGRSMQEYLREELVRLASRPSLEAWLDRVRARKELSGREIGAEQILDHRDADRS